MQKIDNNDLDRRFVWLNNNSYFKWCLFGKENANE